MTDDRLAPLETRLREYLDRFTTYPAPSAATRRTEPGRRRVMVAAAKAVGLVSLAAAVAAALWVHSGRAPVTSSGGSPHPSSAPSPSMTVPAGVVWSILTSDGLVIRAGSPAQGAFRTVAIVPAANGPVVLGASGHRLLLEEQARGHLVDVDLASGVLTDHGGSTGMRYRGAAFSPDGRYVEYVRSTPAQPARLERLDLSTDTVTALVTFDSNLLDVPVTWSSAGIVATQSAGFNGSAPGSGIALLDPATGLRIAQTDTTDLHVTVAANGRTAADSATTPLGDTTGAYDGPPPNTLRRVDIGSMPLTLLAEKDHLLAPLAMTASGATVLYTDEPAGGGLTSATAGGDFGLFTITGGQRTQVAQWDGSTYAGGAYLTPTDFVVAREEGSRTATLRWWSEGRLTQVDSLVGSAEAVFAAAG